MFALKLYTLGHVALAAGIGASGAWRFMRKDSFTLFTHDVLYWLMAFLILGGGSMLLARG